MTSRVLFGLVLLAVAPLRADDAPWPERKTYQFGEFTIEASASDEPYVEALALQLADRPPAVIPPPAPAGRLTLDGLARNRERLLSAMANRIGLEVATPKMGQVFDQMIALWRYLPLAVPSEIPHRFALWRKPDLVARLRAGQKIEGFSLQGDELTYAFAINLPKAPASPAEARAAMNEIWSRMNCPIKIGATEGLSPADDVRASLEKSALGSIESFRAAVAGMERTSVFNVLHETTEAGIVWSFIGSADRRWFCDGVANYVALRLIQQETSPGEARAYYDLDDELRKYAVLAGRIDLEKWPAAENSGQYPEDLNTADYAFATKVIADICARHGDDLLTKWFLQIARTPREKVTMATVAKAYRRLTDEDMRAYLPKPPKK